MNPPTFVPKAPRHAFTVEDVVRLQDQGFFEDPKRIALHEGDIVEMAHDGFRHISLTMALAGHAMRTLDPARFFVGVQTTLRFSRTNAPSPDIYILTGPLPNGDIPPAQIALVIEVADSSLKADLTDSAGRYARAGVAEFWVIDAETREIHVHRGPRDGAYPPPQVIDSAATATPARIPELSIVLDRDVPEV